MAMATTAERGPATPNEIWEILRSTAEQQKENERIWKEGLALREREDAKRREEADKRGAALDLRLDKIMELWDKADRQLKATKSEVGGMSNTFGEMVEHLVTPGIEERLGELGLHFNEISPRRKIKDEQGQIVAELDLLLENNDTVVVVETKGKVGIRDIKRQTEKMEAFREILDKKNDGRRLLGVMAGAVFGKEQKRLAGKAGLWVIVQTGDTMRMDIPDGFKPKEW